MPNRFVYLLQKYVLVRFFILVGFFVIIGGGISYIQTKNKMVPIIDEVCPKIFSKSGLVTISGLHFGKVADDSFLKIDNIVVPSTLCKEWEDKKIVVSADSLGEGGLLFVIAGNNYSGPAFISHDSNIPIVKMQETSKKIPSIEALSRDNGEVGQLIKIYGTNFGNTRENSEVIFWANEEPRNSILLEERDMEHSAHCSEKDFDFEFWSDEEVHIRIPDFASSGFLLMKTKHGLSNAIPFNIKNNVGRKILTHKKTFTFSLKTDVSGIKGEDKNTLFLYTPMPEECVQQGNLLSLFVEPEPLIQNHNGATVHKMDDIKETEEVEIRHQYKITTYELATNIKSSNIQIKDINKKLYNHYTDETPLLPCKNIEIKNMASQIVREDKNPYTRAHKIYQYIIANFKINKDILSDRTQNVLSFLETKQGSPYDASLLFASLCRALDIPCLVASGVVVDDDKKTYVHWWNEFYIQGFGWIPVDIGMALSIPYKKDIKNQYEYYFGSMDNSRLIFSRGDKQMLKMATDSKVYSRERSFGLISFWEEACNINSYTCFWHVPQIIAVN